VYVFPAPKGGPLHAEYWRATVWRPAVARAGLTPMRLHGLKHRRASSPRPAWTPRRSPDAPTTPTPGFTLAAYGHLFPEGDRNAASKLNVLRTTRLDKEQAQP
jgi:hypothetical protein